VENLKISALAEYNYDFSERKKIIIDKYFKFTISNITDLLKRNDLFELIYSNNWSLVEKFQSTLINSNTLTDKAKSEVIDERNFVRKLSLTSFIELDPEFDIFAAHLLKTLEKWASKHYYLYTENRALTQSDLEDFFLNTHNDFRGDYFKVIIDEDHVLFPSGETLYGMTPTPKEKIIIETLLFNSYDETLLYEVVNIVKKIDKSKIKLIAKIAYNYSYISFENTPIKFLNKLASMQSHDNKSLKEMAAAVQVLSPEWHGHGEELLIAVEKLLTK
jgi:hypothetical protein